MLAKARSHRANEIAAVAGKSEKQRCETASEAKEEQRCETASEAKEEQRCETAPTKNWLQKGNYLLTRVFLAKLWNVMGFALRAAFFSPAGL